MSRRFLVVGDPHATVEDLADCKALVKFIKDVAVGQSVDIILFLGDLYHTHAMVNVEVMQFWRNSFAELSGDGFRVEVLLGNHDRPGDSSSTAHALLAHADSDGVEVLDKAFVRRGLGYIPHCATAQEFLFNAHECFVRGAKTLICHQTFTGCLFENGFVVKDGVDDNLLEAEFVISGHIHAPQMIGKVWYPGAPRWRTLSDANTDRAIWVVDFDEDGRVFGKASFATSSACREIRHTKITPTKWDGHEAAAYSNKAPNPTDINVEWRVDVEGPQSFCDTWADHHRKLGHKVRTFVTGSASVVRVKESEGVALSFRKWSVNFKAPHSTPAEVLSKVAEERLGWSAG